MLRKGADPEIRNSNGFSALDFIFTRKNEKLLETLSCVLSDKKLKELDKVYSADRLVELKQKMNGEIEDIFNISDSIPENQKELFHPIQSDNRCLLDNSLENESFDINNTLCEEDNTKLYSEYMNSDNSFKTEKKKCKSIDKTLEAENTMLVANSPKNNQLSAKIEELKELMRIKQINIKKQQKREQKLRTKLEKKKIRKEPFCVMEYRDSKSDVKRELLNHVYSTIRKEAQNYVDWIVTYQRQVSSLYDNVYSKIAKHIHYCCGKEISITKGGSFSCDLLMPWSNLNINVNLRLDYDAYMNQKKPKRQKILDFTQRMGECKKLVASVTQEELYTVTIVKIQLTEKYSNMKVEVVFRHNKKRPYIENEQIINDYIQMYPVVKPLYILFRTFLHNKELDNPGKNGLNTISIILFIVGFIQKKRYQLDENPETSESSAYQNKSSLGKLFLDFICFYAYSFDFNKEGLYTHTNKTKEIDPIIKKNYKDKSIYLTIINPYSREIILTKSFKRTKELRACFKLVHIQIFQICCCDVKRPFSIKKKARLRKSKLSLQSKEFLVDGKFNKTKVNYLFTKNSFTSLSRKSLQTQLISPDFHAFQPRHSMFTSIADLNLHESNQTPKLNFFRKAENNETRKPFFIINRFFGFKYKYAASQSF